MQDLDVLELVELLSVRLSEVVVSSSMFSSLKVGVSAYPSRVVTEEVVDDEGAV